LINILNSKKNKIKRIIYLASASCYGILGEPDKSLAGINKIKKELNWKPKIKIEEGIKELLKNINYWKNVQCGIQSLLTKQQKIGSNF